MKKFILLVRVFFYVYLNGFGIWIQYLIQGSTAKLNKSYFGQKKFIGKNILPLSTKKSGIFFRFGKSLLFLLFERNLRR